MSKLLSIDTSSDVCSVAILEDDKLIKELNITDSKTHSENLMPLIDKLFNETGLKLSEMQAIACSIGPGSFTGIRIGIATVKAMAQVYNLPVVGVTSLETLAEVENNSTVVSLIDARNDQVYCGIFGNGELLADDIHKIIEHLKYFDNIHFVGNGAVLHKQLLENELNNISFSNNNIQSAYSLGKCAFRKLQNGEVQNADTILPLYLRPSQAERMKQNSEL